MMNETNDTNATKAELEPKDERGFFSRMLGRIDESMKSKAEEKSKKGGSCGDGKKGGGKCC